MSQLEEFEKLKQEKDELNARVITAILKNAAKDKRIKELKHALRVAYDELFQMPENLRGDHWRAAYSITRKALEGVDE